MKRSTRLVLVVVALALLPVAVQLQAIIDPQRAQFQPGRGVASLKTEMGQNPVVLPTQFVVGTVIGLREVVAGLLWVRVNDFFHSGNYEAIVPLTRIVTWLDPHQIDVYSVGAWHLAYNFVDYSQRADRRYLMPAMKFLEEGIRNNVNVWDLYFEMGFTMYFSKVLDFQKASEWLGKAAEHDAPNRVWRARAHAIERTGDIDGCIRQWRIAISEAEKQYAKKPNDRGAKYDVEVAKRNLEGIFLKQDKRKHVAEHPINTDFEAAFRRIGPKKFVISGHVNLPEGSRVQMFLTDEAYQEPELKAYSWQLDPKVTLVFDVGIHGISVMDGKFEREYDLSRDPRQYPLVGDKYVLTLLIDPRLFPPEVQDITGWHGEALREGRYLDTSVKGVKRIKKVIVLKREDIV